MVRLCRAFTLQLILPLTTMTEHTPQPGELNGGFSLLRSIVIAKDVRTLSTESRKG